MVKKILPAAVLLVFGGAAQAQLSIYGLVDAGVVNQLREGATTVDFNGNSTTRLGFKGSTDLSSGVKGNFQLEGGVKIDGSSVDNKLFGRQAWVGLSSSYGEVRIGKQDSVPFQTLVGFDFNGGANIASASVAANLGLLQAGRGERSVQFIAPELIPGVKAQVGYQAIDSDSAGNAVPNTRETVSLALTYTLGALSVAAAAESKAFNDATPFAAVAASYDFGIAKVAVSYSGIKRFRPAGQFNAALGSGSGRGTMVSVVAPYAGFNIGLQYARNADTKDTGLEFFVNREILKNTYAYADFLMGENAANSKAYAYALGVIYAF